MQHTPQHFFAPLESLRGLAALCVVLLHLPLWHSVFDLNFLHNSTLMVQFFFVLSGFVIFHSYGEKITSTRDAGRFMWLRFGRLYPVHLVFLIGFIGIEFAKLIAAQHGVHSPNTKPFEDGGLGVIMQLYSWYNHSDLPVMPRASTVSAGALVPNFTPTFFLHLA